MKLWLKKLHAFLRDVCHKHTTLVTLLLALVFLGLSLFFCLFLLPQFSGYNTEPDVQPVSQFSLYEDLPLPIREDLQDLVRQTDAQPQLSDLNVQGSLTVQAAINKTIASFSSMTGEKPSGTAPHIKLVHLNGPTDMTVSDWKGYCDLKQKTILVLWWSKLGANYEEVMTHYAILPWYDGMQWDFMAISMQERPRYPYEMEEDVPQTLRAEAWRRNLKKQLTALYKEGFSYTGSTRLTECVDGMKMDLRSNVIMAVSTLPGDVEVTLCMDPVSARLTSIHAKKI